MTPRWPHRCQYVVGEGFVVWRDVFEGDRKCSLADAVEAHRVATFVSRAEAQDYCDYRNAMTLKYGTDDVSVIEHDQPGAPACPA